ncbi:hypothetical protein [Bradyrhizobium sp. ARR65]|uniref:hypothetical protein n=1 Tax=Bradyrhizobium sp. ARR65 TaxID=1040989 RepID=UPI000462ECD8|nr:hypothetical protein [Bradyrhizobium sp. ARR65]
MALVLSKLVLPPLLILLASLAGRRWGDVIGGWLVGLPLTSGPVAAFLAIQYGADFAALATNGSLVGTAAQACFGLGYALLAQQGWVPALLIGSAAYAGAAFLIQAMPLAHWGFFVVALATLTAAALLIPHRDTLRTTVALPWWDLPARMVVVTVLVVTLTAAAALVGAKVAGVLASFPIFGAILAVFAHRMKGPGTATEVLRGLVFALYGFATFFFILGLLLVKVGILPAFLAAILSTLLVQAGALSLIRRGQVPHGYGP